MYTIVPSTYLIIKTDSYIWASLWSIHYCYFNASTESKFIFLTINNRFKILLFFTSYSFSSEMSARNVVPSSSLWRAFDFRCFFVWEFFVCRKVWNTGGWVVKLERGDKLWMWSWFKKQTKPKHIPERCSIAALKWFWCPSSAQPSLFYCLSLSPPYRCDWCKSDIIVK